jgi:hypothetical protein
LDAYAVSHIHADGDRLRHANRRSHNPLTDRDCNPHQRTNAYANGNANFLCIPDYHLYPHAIYHTDRSRDHYADSDRPDVYPNAHGDTYTNLGRGLNAFAHCNRFHLNPHCN